MNFLAHLHIADNCQSDLLGNLLGDFVKGDPSERYPHAITQGIRLHRYIDSYTDSHPITREAKDLFDPTVKRYAGIALDVLWDHFLARDWSLYHLNTLSEFCNDAETRVKNAQVLDLPERFLLVTQNMWHGRWLESYQQIENIEFALQRMSQRSPRMAPLADCYANIEAEYVQLGALFHQLYPQILTNSRDFCLNAGN
ncbi:acyl carrier protein phosphodiesterase [Vibrio taketomensis]|uniref:acyl carrier protein phosphodiesterase n=1 Tax=Vibrio taketomensis TaxID=2572923 RepID=UPI001389B85A|nr:ACP phosphodiesterase [Vibrio taketomensis]